MNNNKPPKNITRRCNKCASVITDPTTAWNVTKYFTKTTDGSVVNHLVYVCSGECVLYLIAGQISNAEDLNELYESFIHRRRAFTWNPGNVADGMVPDSLAYDFHPVRPSIQFHEPDDDYVDE